MIAVHAGQGSMLLSEPCQKLRCRSLTGEIAATVAGPMPCTARSRPVGRRIAPAVHSAVSAGRRSEAILSPHKQNNTLRGRMSEPLDLTVVGEQSASPLYGPPLGSRRAVFLISGEEPRGLILPKDSAEQHDLFLAATGAGGTLHVPSAEGPPDDGSKRLDVPEVSLAFAGSP